MPLSDEVQSWIAKRQSVSVIVEVDNVSTDAVADAERTRRRFLHDDKSILTMRTRGYRAVKADIEALITSADAKPVRDFDHLPLAVWRVSSMAGLRRLQAHPSVIAVHQNSILRPVSVNDLAFVNQPQVAQLGFAGTGTTIAVIDGGLGSNYLSYSDFGPCTAVNAPAGICRVVVNQDFYPGLSAETIHGTNVSAIALGMAPGAKLAMYDVFNSGSTTTVDVLTAINNAIAAQATYNIVALNMSLGDGTSHSTQCSTSAFKTAINNARSAGISVIVAAGNSGSKTGLSDPACVPNVISVGAVYDASYGTVGWVATADSGGQCFDATEPDHVTCFSQSASYLSLLAPGSFVNAPTNAFQQSGTSQATPHVTGAVAVLRARYPAESLSQTLQRMKLSGVVDTDAANNITTPRLNLLAAVNQGTALSIAGNGPTSATSGGSGTYSLTITNSGPLIATNVVLTNVLPTGVTVTSLSSGCSVSGSIVTCNAASLAVNATFTITIKVSFNSNDSLFDSASLRADQINSAQVSQQTLSIGVPPGPIADAPLPPWMMVLLAGALMSLLSFNERRA